MLGWQSAAIIPCVCLALLQAVSAVVCIESIPAYAGVVVCSCHFWCMSGSLAGQLFLQSWGVFLGIIDVKSTLSELLFPLVSAGISVPAEARKLISGLCVLVMSVCSGV